MKLKVVEYARQQGNLMSVTVQLQEPREINIYKKFLEDEPALKSCPKCGKENKIGNDDLKIRVDSPLSNKIGLNLASPVVTCDHCGEVIPTSMLDYTAFPSIVAFIAQLKKRYQELKKEKEGQKSGS